jgi:CheY-like chemotaxis protein
MANVLLVDDVMESLKPLMQVLRSGGHDVACAKNGLEALEALDDEAPDVVVTDLRMPVMDGEAFLRAVETSPAYHGRWPVILITGAGDEGECLSRAKSLGVKVVLDKGRLTPAELLGAIEHYAGN